MKKKQIKTRKEGESTVLNLFLKSQALCIIVYSLMFLTASLVSLILNCDKSALFYVCTFTFGLSSFLCAFYSANKIGKNGLMIGLIFTLPVNLIIIAISAFCNSFKVDLTLLFSIIILFITSMLGGICAVNKKQKPKVKVRKG